MGSRTSSPIVVHPPPPRRHAHSEGTTDGPLPAHGRGDRHVHQPTDGTADLGVQVENVARAHQPGELDLAQGSQVADRRTVRRQGRAVTEDVHGQNHTRQLGQGLHDEHARHDRVPREVPVEEGVARGDALDATSTHTGHDVVHTVQQEHRPTVRKQGLDLVIVQGQRRISLLGTGGPGHGGGTHEDTSGISPSWSTTKSAIRLIEPNTARWSSLMETPNSSSIITTISKVSRESSSSPRPKMGWSSPIRFDSRERPRFSTNKSLMRWFNALRRSATERVSTAISGMMGLQFG